MSDCFDNQTQKTDVEVETKKSRKYQHEQSTSKPHVQNMSKPTSKYLCSSKSVQNAEEIVANGIFSNTKKQKKQNDYMKRSQLNSD